MYHTLTIDKDIPLLKDKVALDSALTALNCCDCSWILDNPYFESWLTAMNHNPTAFAPSDKHFFSLNEASTINKYHSCIAMASSIITDSLLACGIREDKLGRLI